MLTMLGGTRHIIMQIFFQNWSIQSRDVANFFEFSKWPQPSFIFNITNFWLTGSTGSRLMSISNFGKIGRSKWRTPPSWIFKFVKLHRQTEAGRPRLIIVLNVVKIGRLVVEILQFFEFSKWLPPPSWIFRNREILLAIGEPSWIVEFTKFHWLTVVGWPRRITSPNFVKIGRSIAEMLQFFEFSRWPPPPFGFLKSGNFIGYSGGEDWDASACQIWSKSVNRSRRYSIFQDGGHRHFRFSKSWIFICWRYLETHHCNKFCQNRLFRCGDIAIFWIYKMAAAAILDFWNRKILFGCWGPQGLDASACQILSKSVNRLRRY